MAAGGVVVWEAVVSTFHDGQHHGVMARVEQRSVEFT